MCVEAESDFPDMEPSTRVPSQLQVTCNTECPYTSLTIQAACNAYLLIIQHSTSIQSQAHFNSYQPFPLSSNPHYIPTSKMNVQLPRRTLLMPEELHALIIESPALKPPEGVVPNFVDPERLNNEKVSIVLFVISTIVVWTKLYTKIRIIKKFVLEDCQCHASKHP